MVSTSTPMAPPASDTVWISTLAALVALRIIIPLAVLAAAPARIPLLQAYTYVPVNGDSARYYQGAVNLLVAIDEVPAGWHHRSRG